MTNTNTSAVDLEAIGWAYQKLCAFGVQNTRMDNAMMMDRLNLMLLNPPDERPQWRDIADAPMNMPLWVGAETRSGFKQACATFLLTVQRWYYEDGHTPLLFTPTVFMDLPAPPISRQQDGTT